MKMSIEDKIKGGKNSSRAGIVNKRSTEAKNKMDARKFDPLDNAMDLATGKSNAYIHPYVDAHAKRVNKMINDVLTLEQETGSDLSSIVLALTKLLEHAAKNMSKNYVPVEVRAKMVTELLRYRYPKLKDIEVSGGMKVDIPQLELILSKK